jgi:hypothetical protein
MMKKDGLGNSTHEYFPYEPLGKRCLDQTGIAVLMSQKRMECEARGPYVYDRETRKCVAGVLDKCKLLKAGDDDYGYEKYDPTKPEGERCLAVITCEGLGCGD